MTWNLERCQADGISPSPAQLRRTTQPRLCSFACWMLACFVSSVPLYAQSLDEDLRRISATELATLARREGDAVRGAVVFFQPQMACSKCHVAGKPDEKSLGPDLAVRGPDTTDEHLVEAVLLPSKIIRKGFESATVITTEGKAFSALLVERTAEKLVVRDIQRNGELLTIPAAEIEEFKLNEASIMPAGQANLLNSRQQFLDLIRYLMEIREGGARRALDLQPAATLLTFTVPEYEQHLDHAALIASWNADSLQRGAAIYQRVCGNCHGTLDKPGSLPTSLRFAEGKFKNGSDPLSMYRTLTHGFGLMAPQSWMVPSQKYDVIHYIRETYLRPHNPAQFVNVDASYLSKLPKGDTRGPEPSQIVPWSAMDYGPNLAHTYEIPGLEHNLAYKGIAVRLDPGAGGVSRGRHWVIFDTDTLRTAAAWNGTGGADQNFIDWQGIQFNGAHGIHPRVVGQVAFANSTGPGWGNPADGRFLDDQRVLGRDGKRYGPLPRDWARYRGLYQHGQQIVFSYTVGSTEVLESPGLLTRDGPKNAPLVLRTFNIGPRDRDLLLQVAEHSNPQAQLATIGQADNSVVRVAAPATGAAAVAQDRVAFDGNTYLEIPRGDKFDQHNSDFTIVARIKTRSDGTIWSLTQPGPKWIPNGQTLFVRDGRLGFDIGWVGAVVAKTNVADGAWHTVAASWQQAGHRIRLYLDGKQDGEGTLMAKGVLPNSVARIGFTAPDFPNPATFFEGEISELRFYQRRLTDGLREFAPLLPEDRTLVGRWMTGDASGAKVADATGHGHEAEVRHGLAPVRSPSAAILAGFAPRETAAAWTVQAGHLRLKIPAGQETLRFTVWLPADTATVTAQLPGQLAEEFATLTIPDAARDLAALTTGGPARWPQKLDTRLVLGADRGPFAADILSAPESNPWLAQTRFTGLDFFTDGRIAVCSWDGDVWIVEHLPAKVAQLPAVSEGANAPALRWQRIASGLFQPLGLKIVDGKIHVTCRDQLAVLHDLNGDGEIDFYQCLNNDHQVTEHFHEFAMGLQTDAAGNFYYAKSAEHGRPAVVPHHGTLLRVSKDGSRTDILANGFRAANGVCLNPDGSFVVTDQEGFWNPKNRINWVTVAPSGKPKFYGNMLGYHDVKDSSDAAMVPPLCWITNTFDRSPAELLWVDSDRWGPLKGSLLNLSYGYGKVFVVPHENVQGTMQGGMIELPVPQFPTGVMRGRFQPADGQLYLCGMFAWAGNATYPGGLYRIRATGRPMHLPTELHATKSGLQLKFTERLDPQSLSAKNWHIKTWSLKRTAAYGSNHYGEQELHVRTATLGADGQTVSLEVDGLRPTWCMEIKFAMSAADGAPVVGTIHNTIHKLAD